ncbi:MAG: alanine:cation symporter family protein [Phocaeicola vulgatus]
MSKHLPGVIELIIENAFGWEQALGGGIGMALMQGIKRGLFSNEAGMGSAPNVAATADVTHPVKQGLIQTLGVFTDTLGHLHMHSISSFFSAGWRLQEKPTE